MKSAKTGHLKTGLCQEFWSHPGFSGRDRPASALTPHGLVGNAPTDVRSWDRHTRSDSKTLIRGCMKTKKDQTQQNQNPNDPEYLTDREAAAITKVSRSHLHALMACGKIRCHKIGKCLRLVKSEIGRAHV